MKRGQDGFTALESLLVIIVIALIVSIGGYVLHVKNSSDKTTSDISVINKKSVVVVTDTSNPENETINGTAYQSPSSSEGMSIKYTQNYGCKTYNPFVPLQNHISSTTKVTNANNKTIPFSSVKVGDNIIVHMSRGPCISAAEANSGGCNVNILSVQDLAIE
jgi:prepilin-type N-terminal cleavage/methylation domain-containing protein